MGTENNPSTPPQPTPSEPAFAQGAQESGSSGAAEQVAGMAIEGDPALSSGAVPEQPQQQAGLPQNVGAPGKVFTESDVERIRREEKAKLYGRIEEESGRVKELMEKLDAREAAEKEAQQAAEEAQRKAEEEEMSARELIARREAEWAAQEAERDAQLQDLREQIGAQQALLEREKQFQELAAYRQNALANAQTQVIPELLDYVTGNTPEEIDASIASLAQRSASIMQNMAQAADQAPGRTSFQGSKVTMPPVGPMDTQTAQQPVTAEQVANMSMAEYQQHRNSLLASVNRRVHERGLYD